MEGIYAEVIAIKPVDRDYIRHLVNRPNYSGAFVWFGRDFKGKYSDIRMLLKPDIYGLFVAAVLHKRFKHRADFYYIKGKILAPYNDEYVTKDFIDFIDNVTTARGLKSFQSWKVDDQERFEKFKKMSIEDILLMEV